MSFNVKIQEGVIPTTETKLQLAGKVSVPPIVWNWTPEAEKDAKEAFDAAIELGIPFYDTAEVYGKGESEREIKRFRESYSEEEKKKQIIATKYFPYEERTQFPDVLLSALKDSLERLGTLNVDLYQIHAAIHPVEIEVVANALADAHDQGLVKAVGVSNYSLDEIKRMHAALQKRGIQLASNQISYSLVRTIPEKSGLIKLCHELGVAILAYSPLGMGLLTGKFDLDAPPPKGRENQFTKFDKKQLKQLIDVVRRIAQKYQREPSAIALNWCIVKGTIPLGGARTASHVTQNVRALDFRLTPEEVDELDALAFVGENNNRWNHG
ncbi:Aldo/keto reductase [Backusella circina FSU 941]|nr:Aldo/keto reductase [Backusella circina FSU 941]